MFGYIWVDGSIRSEKFQVFFAKKANAHIKIENI